MQITDITPYLPYYLGCEASTGSGKVGKLVSVSETTSIIVYPDDDPRGRVAYTKWITPHLRPFSDFTVDDLKGWHNRLLELNYPYSQDEIEFIGSNKYTKEDINIVHIKGIKAFNMSGEEEYTPHLITYLCSREIDVFGLIPAGLAKTKKEEGK